MMTKKRIKKFVEEWVLNWRISDEQQGTKMVSIAMLAAIGGTVLQFVAFPIMPAFIF